MSSSTKPTKGPKVDVHFNKSTGGAYVDIRQVIESELHRIREESARKTASNVDANNDKNADRTK